MTDKRLAMVAEASPLVGTGHLRETMSLSREAKLRGLRVGLWVNESAPGDLLERANVSGTVRDFRPSACRALARKLDQENYRTILLNIWKAKNDQVKALKSRGAQLVCVDELGGRRLDTEAVVNFSIDANKRCYLSSVPGFRLFSGPQYLSLDRPYQRRHARSRSHSGPIRKIAVSLGGVDRSGATERVVGILKLWRPNVEKHVVLGPGFQNGSRIRSVAGANFVFHKSPRTLVDLLSGCDVGLTAGGNTLFEMACVGTPAIVLWEDPHERQAGEALAHKGFGLVVSRGAEVKPTALIAALKKMDDPAVRQRHLRRGKALIDGRGAQRIVDIIVKRFLS